MNQKQMKLKADQVCWRHFSRKGYAIFCSLSKEIRIGVLSVATLTAAAPSLAAGGIATTGVINHDEFTGPGDSLTTGDGDETDLSILQEGDLLFNVVAKKAGTGGAIADVTQGVSSQPVVHVAIVCKMDNKMFALEASGKHGVWLNPIDSFFVHADHSSLGKPMVLAARLKDTTNVSKSVEKALSYLGRPYDYLFGDSEDSIYCSELVHYSYLDRDGHYIFPQQPMSFHDASGKVTQFWIDAYAKHGLSVPEGEPGTNPGALSRSEKIVIIKSFY